MANSMRGSRMGTTSYETDSGLLAPRALTTYVCDQGHQVTMPFSTEADEIPGIWPCSCGAIGMLVGSPQEEVVAPKHVRSHWDMLLERRTLKDLEGILKERLDELRHPRKFA